jgi:perosamine synthetase
MADMAANAIETRPVFFCAHHLPFYAGIGTGDGHFPVAEDIAARGLSLPSYPSLTRAEIKHIVQSLRKSLAAQGKPAISA